MDRAGNVQKLGWFPERSVNLFFQFCQERIQQTLNECIFVAVVIAIQAIAN